MDDGRKSCDETQRTRLARILNDPGAYYADARREAHEQAKRFVEAKLQGHGARSAGRR